MIATKWKQSHKKLDMTPARGRPSKKLSWICAGPALAYLEAMHRRWNAFIAAAARTKQDATIEPLQARPQSYG